ncbi:four helix bundle protein [Aquimarina sp. ERC-38]|uniref:four helix bundle protein n=1 Tax=Aquimarina sp. ERC-38 TaxID=2949996 RepID=UPI0022482B6B|nr:four helix bundle protein [Aquimarina sp. ERC-38]
MSYMNDSPIRKKSFDFACDIVHFAHALKEKKEYEIASQVLRSGTSIGANIREAQRGVSTKDFKHKFGIALKEADETEFWLLVIQETIMEIPNDLLRKCDELIRILVKIIKNS